MTSSILAADILSTENLCSKFIKMQREVCNGATQLTKERSLLNRPYTKAFIGGIREDLRLARRRFERIDSKIISRYFNETSVRKLQIGAGENPKAGWLNTNINPSRTDNVFRLDARVSFPFPNESFDYIFSEHMIEHVPLASGINMMRECVRILKPGGKIRISTPDLQFLIDLQQQELSEQQRQYIGWAGRAMPNIPMRDRPAVVMNNYVRAWGHSFIYDQSTLAAIMANAGLVNIVPFPIGDSDDPELMALENEARMPPGMLQIQTMTFQALKPI